MVTVQYGLVVRVMPEFITKVFEAVSKDRGEVEMIPAQRSKLQSILHSRRAAVKEERQDELVRVANDETAKYSLPMSSNASPSNCSS